MIRPPRVSPSTLKLPLGGHQWQAMDPSSKGFAFNPQIAPRRPSMASHGSVLQGFRLQSSNSPSEAIHGKPWIRPPRVSPSTLKLPLGGHPWQDMDPSSKGFCLHPTHCPSEALHGKPWSCPPRVCPHFTLSTKPPTMQLGVDERSVNCIAKKQPHTSSNPIYEADPKRRRKHLMA